MAGGLPPQAGQHPEGEDPGRPAPHLIAGLRVSSADSALTARPQAHSRACWTPVLGRCMLRLCCGRQRPGLCSQRASLGWKPQGGCRCGKVGSLTDALLPPAISASVHPCLLNR